MDDLDLVPAKEGDTNIHFDPWLHYAKSPNSLAIKNGSSSITTKIGQLLEELNLKVENKGFRRFSEELKETITMVDKMNTNLIDVLSIPFDGLLKLKDFKANDVISRLEVGGKDSHDAKTTLLNVIDVLLEFPKAKEKCKSLKDNLLNTPEL